ncbi:MAG: peptidoglycan DD-metalloendopeptidase family protein [Anaerolineales bacterium]|jgi:murein DD-endopeptidase MepM/ murein hydrolase activator NlpD
MKRTWLKLFLTILMLFPIGIAQAQEGQPDGPVYIVQAGDNLWGISQRFGVSIDELASKNDLSDPGQLTIGMQLVIPGLDGLQGVLTTQDIPFGESLWSLSRRYEIPLGLMVRLNKYTSPESTAAGSSLILPEPDDEEKSLLPQGDRVTLESQQSLLEVSILQGTNPWDIMSRNELTSVWEALPGETLHFPGDDVGPGALPDTISTALADDLPVIQGQTLSIKLSAPPDMILRGEITGKQLNFFLDEDNIWKAIQGIHVMLEPGYYPLTLNGSLPDGTDFSFSQIVYVSDGNYPYDPPLAVDSVTVEIENTTQEDLMWKEIVSPVTPERLWTGIFSSPVPAVYSDCFPSKFGHRRSYNGSNYDFFHSGLDFCGQIGTDIYAPADGVVVFTDPVIVRGNATVIDHGWGVYTAYGHQSEILVNVGDQVEKGQLIGRVGETGRVSGPHLHWEVIAGGVQVDPLQWLAREFP